MRILVYGLNFLPEPIGIGAYTGQMALWLAKRGHEVRVVTAPPYYPAWEVMLGYSGRCYRKERKQNLTVWRCPIWVPTSKTGVHRIVHLLSFAVSSAPVALRQAFWKPDVVWVVAPSLFCAPVAWLTARLCGAGTWLHIQDFEVHAAFETGLLRLPALRRLSLWAERKLLGQFDRVSTISRNMISHLRKIGVEEQRCVLFPNWVDVQAIRPLQEDSVFRQALGIQRDVAVVLYSGNMGEKQGLETLLEAARQMRTKESILFVMCGDGTSRARLIQEFGDLPNVMWLPLQPADRLNELLNLADIHALPQLAGVADLVMPSKLSGMLASGRPVVATAAAGTQIEAVISRCGIVVPPGQPRALAAALETLGADITERLRLGIAARNHAIENLDSAQIFSHFELNLAQCRRTIE